MTTATRNAVPAALSDVFFNSKQGEEAFEQYCLSGESEEQGRTRMVDAARAFINQLEAVGANITVTPAQLADDFIARV